MIFKSYKDEPDPEDPNPVLMEGIQLVICILFLVMMMAILCKVFQIVRFGDKTILGMLLFLNLELISSMMFYSTLIYEEHHPDYNYTVVDVMILITPVLFFSIAITINLKNW